MVSQMVLGFIAIHLLSFHQEKRIPCANIHGLQHDVSMVYLLNMRLMRV